MSPKKSKSKKKPKSKKRIMHIGDNLIVPSAYHEAGHAVLNVCFGLELGSIGVMIDGAGCGICGTKHIKPNAKEIYTRAQSLDKKTINPISIIFKLIREVRGVEGFVIWHDYITRYEKIVISNCAGRQSEWYYGFGRFKVSKAINLVDEFFDIKNSGSYEKMLEGDNIEVSDDLSSLYYLADLYAARKNIGHLSKLTEEDEKMIIKYFLELEKETFIFIKNKNIWGIIHDLAMVLLEKKHVTSEYVYDKVEKYLDKNPLSQNILSRIHQR